MTMLDLLLAAAVVVVVALAVRSLHRAKKNGTGCCGSCAGCAQKGCCSAKH